MKIFIGIDEKGDVWITDDAGKLPVKMVRLHESDFPARGTKRDIIVAINTFTFYKDVSE